MDKVYDQFGFTKPTKMTKEEQDDLMQFLCKMAVNDREGLNVYLKCCNEIEKSENYRLHLETLTEEERGYIRERKECQIAILEGIREYINEEAAS